MPAELTVGLVIPAHQAQAFIAETLADVLAQDLAPTDVVVVDDGSSDRTGEIAAAFGPPVRVLRQENAGIGAARNRGVDAVRGDVVAFVDADDRVPPRSFSSRVALLAADPSLDLVFGMERRFRRTDEHGPVAEGPARVGHVPGMMVVRRTALQRVGPFLETTGVAEGLDWLLRARELGLREATVDEHVGWRRLHGANNSLRNRESISEFAVALKASLDRRRAGGGT